MDAYSLEYDLPFADAVLDLLTRPMDQTVKNRQSDIHRIASADLASDRIAKRREFLAALRAAEAEA